jgi:hypothetical protein
VPWSTVRARTAAPRSFPFVCMTASRGCLRSIPGLVSVVFLGVGGGPSADYRELYCAMQNKLPDWELGCSGCNGADIALRLWNTHVS